MKERKEKEMATLSDIDPEMASNEWHALYNAILGLCPETISAKSGKDVYWKCPKCSGIYRMSPKDRLEKKERGMESCFRCRGRVQLHVFTV